MGYSAKAVANYFLSKYGKHGITPLKIQKLVYLAHGWYMAFYDDPLVDDEFAEAWEFGPVFASLYHEFKHRGKAAIVDLATEVDFELNETTPKISKSDHRAIAVLEKTWEVYGHRTGWQLSELCHKPGSPWAETRNAEEWRRNAHINDAAIRDYYKSLRERNLRKRDD